MQIYFQSRLAAAIMMPVASPTGMNCRAERLLRERCNKDFMLGRPTLHAREHISCNANGTGVEDDEDPAILHRCQLGITRERLSRYVSDG